MPYGLIYPQSVPTYAGCGCIDGCSIFGSGATASKVADSLCGTLCGDGSYCGGTSSDGKTVYYAVYNTGVTPGTCGGKAQTTPDIPSFRTTSATSTSWGQVGGLTNVVEFKVNTNPSGAIEVYATVAGDGSVWTNIQSGTGFPQSWTFVGGVNQGFNSLGVVQNQNGRTQLFVVDNVGQAWTTMQSAIGSTKFAHWYTLPGTCMNIEPVYNADGTLGAICIGPGNWLYYSEQTAVNQNSWTSQIQLNTQYTVAGSSAAINPSSLTACETGDGRWVAFGLTVNANQIIYAMQSSRNANTVNSWKMVSFSGRGGFAKTSCFETDHGGIVLFGVDSSNNVWYSQQTAIGSDSWKSWAKLNLAASVISGDDASAAGGAALAAIDLSTQDAFLITFAESNTGVATPSVPNDLGGGPFSSVESTRTNDGTSYVFASNPNGGGISWTAIPGQCVDGAAVSASCYCGSNLCPSGNYCSGGSCVSSCSGSSVITMSCMCGTGVCDAGNYCSGGTCISSCSGSNTLAATCMCGTTLCPSGSFCSGTSCLSACSGSGILTQSCMCGSNTCMTGSTCSSGTCTPPCPNNSNSYVSNTCICGSTSCPAGNVCRSGVCTQIPWDCKYLAALYTSISPYLDCCSNVNNPSFVNISCDANRRVTTFAIITNTQPSSTSTNPLIPQTLPDLSGLTALQILLMSNNNIGGQFPTTWCSMKSLQSIDLNSNSLTGSVPSCINSLTALTYL
ncbi:hypothetical protein HDU79_001087 [Rhizoclosmatium sp. JEL0117]|nr:hypothetical protein HDU79_001087 [Rhizoclosmatium sp. JEL0117]